MKKLAYYKGCLASLSAKELDTSTRALAPKVGYELARRQRGQDAVVIERSWRCQQRLYQRWQRMAGRGKPQQQIVVACARELAGFVWAIATDQPLRSV